MIGYGLGPPAIGWFSDQGTRYQLSSVDAPVTQSECGRVEKSLSATRRGTDGALEGAELEAAMATNEQYCKPARAFGNRLGVSIGSLFLLWAALHFLLMGRTMQRDLWTEEASTATA